MTATGKPQNPEAEKAKAPTCAICGKPVDPAHKPFCSKRCANVDLNRWLNNCYTVAGAPQDDYPADDESESE
jgi:endogenous inhibitor of DNA gyrase (YacG/DUF329 family)